MELSRNQVRSIHPNHYMGAKAPMEFCEYFNQTVRVRVRVRVRLRALVLCFVFFGATIVYARRVREGKDGARRVTKSQRREEGTERGTRKERCSDKIRVGKVRIWTRLPENARPAHAFGQRDLGVAGTRC